MLSEIKKNFIPYSIFLLIIILISGALQSMPLTNIIGYEFSAITSFYLFLIGGISTIIFAKKNGSGNFGLRTLWAGHKLFFILISLLPLIISAGNTIFNSVCPLWDGLFFYFVITIPSIIIGIFLGYSVFEIFNKYRILIFIALFIFICFGPVMEIYSNPQVYFYNPIIGFFPGNIYDEDISVDLTLVMYRLLNLILFVGIGYSIVYLKPKTKKFKPIIILSTVIVAASFSLLKPLLGFATNEPRLYHELGKALTTKHFNIVHPKDADEKFIELLGMHHEYYFEELSEFFGFEPEEKITSFIFNDSKQKRKLFGAGNADVAKPWMNQIYIELESYDRSLKHELVHVFSAKYGTTPFKIADGFNPAMIEGLAVAVENNYNDYDVHYIASLANEYGHKPNVKKLFSGFNFFSGISTLSYIQSGSFIKYLFEKYENEKVLKLYSDLNFKKYFNKSIDELSAEYSEYLDTLNFGYNKHEANLYFGRRPLIKRVCPRYTANQLKSAWKNYNDKNYNNSLEEFSELLSTTESYSALLGKVYSLNRLEQYSNALNELTVRISDYEKTSYLYNLELVLADNYLTNNKLEKADSLYRVLISQAPSYTHYFAAANRKNLLTSESATAQNYLNSDPDKKWELLFELNNKSFSFESALSLIQLAKDKKDKFNQLNQLMKDKLVVGNHKASYIAFRLSKLALRYSDFESAKYWAVNSLKYVENKNHIIFKENLKIINTFINLGSEYRKDFKFIIDE